MKRKLLVLALTPLFFTHTTLANDTWDGAKTYFEKGTGNVKKWIHPEKSPQNFSFQELFPKPFYNKSYFPLAMTGTLVVLNGALLLLFPPAGAPAAMLGTGPIATWVGGGAAGSYMAGLSTIGGWFGGNATLGAAILNGVSSGVTGGVGVSKFASMSAIGKVGVLSAVTATTLDGVALIEKPETESLNFQIRLMLPTKIGSKEVQGFAKEMQHIDEQLQLADGKKDGKSYELWAKKKQAQVDIGKKWVKEAQESNSVSENDLIVYGIFSKNIGDPTWYSSLISRVRAMKSANNTGYLDYLEAVANIEDGNLEVAENLLYSSRDQNPYAIEPYLLLVNLLGKNFQEREKDIQALAAKARNDFNPDKYNSAYSLVSLFYRIGTMYLVNNNFDMANQYFDSALDEMSLLQKHLGGKQIVNLIQIGKANALYGLNKTKDADLIYQQVLKNSDASDQVDFYRSQYIGAN